MSSQHNTVLNSYLYKYRNASFSGQQETSTDQNSFFFKGDW